MTSNDSNLRAALPRFVNDCMGPREDRGTRLANEAGEPLMTAAAMRLEDEIDDMNAMDDAMGLNDY